MITSRRFNAGKTETKKVSILERLKRLKSYLRWSIPGGIQHIYTILKTNQETIVNYEEVPLDSPLYDKATHEEVMIHGKEPFNINYKNDKLD